MAVFVSRFSLSPLQPAALATAPVNIVQSKMKTELHEPGVLYFERLIVLQQHFPRALMVVRHGKLITWRIDDGFPWLQPTELE